MASQSDSELGMLAPIDEMMHPYRQRLETVSQLPSKGHDRKAILREMEELKELEQARWENGFASGSVYNGDAEHIDFVNKVYAIQSQSNPLHPDIWPSAAKFEAEIVSMTAHMLGAGETTAPFGSEEGICGSVSSGGSESILLAMKTYRDWARETKGITAPEIVLPVSAHAAFHKAAQYFNLDKKVVPLDDDFRADVSAMEAAITPNTIALVASAVNFPYGTIDPIDKLGELAQIARHRPAHRRLPGRILSALGREAGATGAAVRLPRAGRHLHVVRHAQIRLCSQGHLGRAVPRRRATALSILHHRRLAGRAVLLAHVLRQPARRSSAACWAALVSMGESGYLAATEKILAAVATMRKGIAQIPELHMLGHPLGPFAFGSEVAQHLPGARSDERQRLALTGLLNPAAIHVSPTLRHTQPGVAERFVEDLKASVAYVRDTPDIEGGMAPIYGLAASIPDRSIVHGMLKQVMDVYYRL